MPRYGRGLKPDHVDSTRRYKWDSPCEAALPPMAMNRRAGADFFGGRALPALDITNRDHKRFNLSRQYAEELRAKATTSEKLMCDILDAAMISYVFQSNMCDRATGRIYISDFRIRRVPPRRPPGARRKTWRRDDRKLFIEIDGSSHVGREAYDGARTRWIESHRNAIVLRFTNEDVMRHPESILREIEAYSPARRKTRLSYTSLNRPRTQAVRRSANILRG